jgi:hypothetical protein
MKRILIGALAIVGTLFCLNAYYPLAWVQSFPVGQHHVAYAFPILGLVGYLAFFGKIK